MNDNRYRAPVLSPFQVIHELDAAMRADGRMQREVMKKAGVTQHAYYLWKKGEFAPSLVTLAAVAEVLGYRVTLTPIKEQPDGA
jgi:transcriptional regulator with XRE-family HTH domain